MPPGMTMSMTFAESGTVSMTMSGGPGEQPARQGTWSVSDKQVTISIDHDTKTGTLTFEGNDRAILDFAEAKMTLTRSSG